MPKYLISVQMPAWYYAQVVVEAADGERAKQAVEEAIREGYYDPVWQFGSLDVDDAQAYWYELVGDDVAPEVSEDAQV